jgi:hypothetical protein
MAKNRHPQAPDFRVDPDGFLDWANSIHDGVYGINEGGGTLNGDNFVDMTDPGDTTDVSDTATVLNNLLAELRTSGLI